MPAVTIQRGLLWNVKTVVSKTRLLRYNVRTIVTNSREILFDVDNSAQSKVTITRTLLWGSSFPVLITRALSRRSESAGCSTADEFVPAPNVFDFVYTDAVGLFPNVVVTWDMHPHFVEDTPWTFQLQVSNVGVCDADDWEDVGAAVVDVFTQTDDTQRWFGKTPTPHYRVKLTVGSSTYYSPSEPVLGQLNWAQVRHAREIIRKETLRHVNFSSVDGWLLKQRRNGVRCPDCLDEPSNTVTNSQCTTCYGTQWDTGYYRGLASWFADVSGETASEKRGRTGMVKSSVIQGRFLAHPQMYAHDLFVAKHSGQRYQIRTLKTEAHIRGVPIVSTAEMRLLPPDDIAYQVPIS